MVNKKGDMVLNTILEDEITEEEFFYYYKKPIIIIVVVIMSLFSQNAAPILIYVFLFLFFKIAFFVLNSRRLVVDNERNRLRSRRTKCIKATVQKINVIADVEYDEIQVFCQATINGTNIVFKSKKMRSMPSCKIGEQVNVMIQPDNHNNYEVLIDEIL